MSKFSDMAAATHPDTAPKSTNDSKIPAQRNRSLTSAEIHVRGAILAQNEALTKRVEELTDRLVGFEQNPGILEIPIDQLHEIPGRKRSLDTENYNILKNNLEQNDLITPIIVRKRDAGGYEIISGHNRTQAFRDLGRTSIPAVIADISDENANKDAFFANLIHSALPDYEKYLGLKKMLAEHPVTQESLAASIGIPSPTLSRILSFGKLPESALSILDKAPNAIGYNTVNDLVKLTGDGHAELVTKAIQLIANKDLDQAKAKNWVQKELAGAKQTAPPPSNKPVIIKRGKAPFCSMRTVNQSIRLEFQSPADANAYKDQIHELLKAMAKDSQ